ncbi:MAG TPA: hypothetical protein VL863_07860, partial [bacterium]|nr:hypothetical protein [bacterium]
AYIFLLKREPDALRSESFALSKMAIERGLVGDSQHELAKPSNNKSQVVSSGPLLISNEEIKQ